MTFSVNAEETVIPVTSNGANIYGMKLGLNAALSFHF